MFEVPLGLMNKSVEARFHEDTPEEVEVYFDGRSYGFVRLVDTRVNARVGRAGATRAGAKAPREVAAPQAPITPRSGELFGRAATTEEA